MKGSTPFSPAKKVDVFGNGVTVTRLVFNILGRGRNWLSRLSLKQDTCRFESCRPSNLGMGMKSKEQQVVELLRLGTMKYQEIASAVGCSKSTVDRWAQVQCVT